MPINVSLFIFLQLGAIAFFVSLAVTGFSRLGGLGDIPDHRSSHALITPTAGGIGIMAGIGAAFLTAALFHAELFFVRPGSVEKLASCLSLTFAMSFLGLVDDRFELRPSVKFPIILLICLFGCLAIGSVSMLPYKGDHIYLLWWSALGGSVLWLFTVTNAVNFSDGINGMFATTLGIASAGLCALAIRVGAPVTALLSGVLTASLMGFLPYNFRRRAAIFSGDCGSLGAAFLYGSAVLYLIYEQPELRLLYAGPLLILPVLTDILITLLRKPFMGIPLSAPHHFHIFQRWARKRNGHRLVSLFYGLATALMVVIVHEAYGRGTLGSMSGLALLTSLFVCLYLALSTWLPD